MVDLDYYKSPNNLEIVWNIYTNGYWQV